MEDRPIVPMRFTHLKAMQCPSRTQFAATAEFNPGLAALARRKAAVGDGAPDETAAVGNRQAHRFGRPRPARQA
jgi:hypothetical protein